MLAASIHLSRGTPFIYMGEEIGMVDPDFASIEDYVDVEATNAYDRLLQSGKTKAEAFDIVKAKARDNSRTPMQWDDSAQAGFTSGVPWLKLGSHRAINVKAEKNGEIFNFYKKLIRLRKTEKIISEGTYHAALIDSPEIYAFERSYGEQRLLVLNNFTDKAVSLELPSDYANGKVLISNYKDFDGTKLQAYQTVAILR